VAQDNLETVRQIYRAMAGGYASPDSLKLFHPDVEYVNPEGAIDTGTRRGHDGIRQVAHSLETAFSEFAWDVQDLIPRGDNVIALTTFKARGRDSGALVEVPEQHVWTLRDGKVARFGWFHDERKARKVAGL
jgi:uncharacterized protein